MDLSYKNNNGSVEIGIGGATISEVIAILDKLLLPDLQAKIDAITARVKGLTVTLSDSNAALERAISKEK